MAYIKYEVDLNEGMYSDYDKVRKTFIGDKLSKADVCAALDMLPMNSPKLWNLFLKYEIILRFGKAAGTYYMMPKELPPYARFESIEQEFYNGATKPSIKKKDKPQEREIERTPLTEEYCIEYLKKRNYVVFKVEPDFNKLREVLTPGFLLQNSKAELK
jgi:hypothetical protein